MNQLICASLSHTHYWYEVGMLKVPAIKILIIIIIIKGMLLLKLKLILIIAKGCSFPRISSPPYSLLYSLWSYDLVMYLESYTVNLSMENEQADAGRDG